MRDAFPILALVAAGCGDTRAPPMPADLAAAATPDLAQGSPDLGAPPDLAAAAPRDFAVTPPAPSMYFAAEVEHRVEYGPTAVAVADLDGDGKPDVVTCSPQKPIPGREGSLTVLRGKGGGAFLPPVAYAIGAGCVRVAAADLTGDGKPDVLVSGGHALELLVNDGTGALAASAAIAPQGGQGAVGVLGDVDGDGRPDVLFADPTRRPSLVGLMRNKGGGTFDARVDHPFEEIATRVGLGDVDGDGTLDAVAGSYGPERRLVTTFLNRGDGTLGDGIARPVETKLSRIDAIVELGDLDGDRKADAVIGAQPFLPGDIENRIAVLRSEGGGKYGAEVPYLLPEGPLRAAVIGDLTADRKPDVALSAGFAIRLLVNNGAGALVRAMEIPKRTPSGGLAIAYLDGDGKNDLVAANLAVDTISVYLGKTP